VPDVAGHRRKHFVLGSSFRVALDRVEIQPFVEFVTMVADAPKGSGGKGFVRSGFLKECRVTHPFGEGGIRGGPGKLESRLFPVSKNSSKGEKE